MHFKGASVFIQVCVCILGKAALNTPIILLNTAKAMQHINETVIYLNLSVILDPCITACQQIFQHRISYQQLTTSGMSHSQCATNDHE